MTLTRVKVVIRSIETNRFEEVELLIDTGSIFTWIRGRTLDKLGVKRRRLRRFKTIDGRIVERWTGIATIVYESYEGDTEVVFAEDSDAEVLGITALETLGLEIDPITGRLRYIGHLAI